MSLRTSGRDDLLIHLIYKILPELGKYLPTLPWMLFVAWGSHHVRDAQRRGLWFPPFGSTPNIPYTMYLLTEFILPIIIKCIFRFSKNDVHSLPKDVALQEI